ncbi:hypothetical protein KUTeg_005753, partial [Tegillarca granosa]
LLSSRPKQQEYNSAQNDAYVTYSKVPRDITFKSFTTTSHLFLTVISNDEGSTKDYLYEAYVVFMNGSLETSHTNAWIKSWEEGRIDLTGNIPLARVTYASYYYILSSVLPPDPDILVKPWPFVGLSPGDLAHGALGRDYAGHVFWDQETWMYPPVLMLHSEMGKAPPRYVADDMPRVYNLTNVITEPTRITSHSSTLLDPIIRHVWNYKNADFDLLGSLLSDFDWLNHLDDTSNADEACEMTGIRKKNRLRRAASRCPSSNNVTKFKSQRNKVTNMKKYAKQQYFSSIDSTLDQVKSSNPRTYWKIIKSLIGKSKTSNVLPPLQNSTGYAFSDSDKCNMLNDYFCSVARLEVCPGEKFARYEQHITGDIAFALKQYYMMSNDTDFIQNGRGGELINEIANYWTSRVVYNEQKQLYEIPGVMPPDEFHSPVNNSAYTNVVAKISLLMTKDILPLINMNSTKFEEIGNKMYIPFDESAKFHPEYDGYKLGTIIKQADVILLGFPLMQNLTTEVRKNDLTIYEKVTPGGPAMTWGMFAIGWIELGDMTKAEELFKRQMLNVNKPFNVWSEVPLGLGALNFITGSGGYLQSLIFGYGGFRIREDKLEFNGNLPPNVTCFNITGVDYLQGSLSFSFWDYGMSVKQTKTAKTNLMVVLDFSGEKTLLTVGRTVSYGRQKAAIAAAK